MLGEKYFSWGKFAEGKTPIIGVTFLVKKKTLEGKNEEMLVTCIFSFPRMFFKVLFHMAVKSAHCVIKVKVCIMFFRFMEGTQKTWEVLRNFKRKLPEIKTRLILAKQNPERKTDYGYIMVCRASFKVLVTARRFKKIECFVNISLPNIITHTAFLTSHNPEEEILSTLYQTTSSN